MHAVRKTFSPLLRICVYNWVVLYDVLSRPIKLIIIIDEVLNFTSKLFIKDTCILILEL